MTGTIRQRQDRASDAFAAVAHEAEILTERMTQLAARMRFVHPADQAAVAGAIASVTAAAKQFRYLAIRAKGGQ